MVNQLRLYLNCRVYSAVHCTSHVKLRKDDLFETYNYKFSAFQGHHCVGFDTLPPFYTPY
jgi:hypothetical protein